MRLMPVSKVDHGLTASQHILATREADIASRSRPAAVKSYSARLARTVSFGVTIVTLPVAIAVRNAWAPD